MHARSALLEWIIAFLEYSLDWSNLDSYTCATDHVVSLPLPRPPAALPPSWGLRQAKSCSPRENMAEGESGKEYGGICSANFRNSELCDLPPKDMPEHGVLKR